MRPAPLLAVLLVVFAARAAGAAQDGDGAADATAAATAPVEVPHGDDGLPEPSFWTFDAEAPARVWLDKPPIDPDDLLARLPAWEEALASHGLTLDVEARTVTLRGATLMDARYAGDPIEYLVVTELGRTHEALVLVRCQPSVLDACLRALGLRPGGHTAFEEKDPPPSPDDVEHGRASPWLVHPAHGPLVSIELSWIDEAGRPARAPLESLLVDVRSGEALPSVGWIYTGSRFGEYRQGRVDKRWFKSDVEGDVVAIYLAGRDSCLFERNSLQGLADTWWFPNPEKLPPPGTPATLVLRPTGEAVPARDPVEGERVDWSSLDEEAEAANAAAAAERAGAPASPDDEPGPSDPAEPGADEPDDP